MEVVDSAGMNAWWALVCCRVFQSLAMKRSEIEVVCWSLKGGGYSCPQPSERAIRQEQEVMPRELSTNAIRMILCESLVEKTHSLAMRVLLPTVLPK